MSNVAEFVTIVSPGIFFDVFILCRGTMGDRASRADGGDTGDPPADAEPVVTCTFQDGTLHVSRDTVSIERANRSRFDDKRIDLRDVEDVTYRKRLVISYIQIEQRGFVTDDASLLSTPVDENTLHFGRGQRECAQRARDEILSRISVE